MKEEEKGKQTLTGSARVSEYSREYKFTSVQYSCERNFSTRSIVILRILSFCSSVSETAIYFINDLEASDIIINCKSGWWEDDCRKPRILKP